VTTRDISDFKDFLRRQQNQAVATINRPWLLWRRFFGWLAEEGHIPSNPVKKVKELRRQQLAPKGLSKAKCGGCFGKLNSAGCSGGSDLLLILNIPDADAEIWLPLNYRI